MVILRESFQALNDSMGAMLAAMPDSERDILQNRWKLTTENFEKMFSNYLKQIDEFSRNRQTNSVDNGFG